METFKEIAKQKSDNDRENTAGSNKNTVNKKHNI
jgi:hypothetical protein